MTVEPNNNKIQVERVPLYFGSDDKQLFGWLHFSKSTEPKDTGVVICSPIAAEYISSHRSLRHLADAYARAGMPAIRFDYHGIGDSSGQIEDDDRMQSWYWSAQQAMHKLKELTGVLKVGAVGLRFGSVIASRLAESSALEFLILWVPIRRGRAFNREIKAMQMTSESQPDAAPALLEAGGMVYWDKTADDINSINLEKSVPNASHILVIPRDNLTPDTKLLEAWQEKNLNVEQIELEGSTGMLQDAAFTVVPHESFGKVVAWTTKVGDIKASDVKVNFTLETLSQNIDFKYYDVAEDEHNRAANPLNERFHRWGEGNKRFAIITEMQGDVNKDLPVIVILNSGATHHVGPNQINLLMARSLASSGFRCVRADLRGLGDSVVDEKENVEYLKGGVNEISELITSLEGLGKSFVLTGLCSGAYFSYRAALLIDNKNISECLLLNPLTFYWEEGMAFENSPSKNFSNWNWYKQTIKNPKSWLKLFSGKADVGFLLKTISNRIKIKLAALTKHNRVPEKNSAGDSGKSGPIKDLAVGLRKISEKNIHIGFVLSRNDPGYDILMTSAGKMAKKLIKQNRLNIDFIEGADHTFSKYKPRRAFIAAIVKHLKSRYMP